jgi:hypothetical protein
MAFYLNSRSISEIAPEVAGKHLEINVLAWQKEPDSAIVIIKIVDVFATPMLIAGVSHVWTGVEFAVAKALVIDLQFLFRAALKIIGRLKPWICGLATCKGPAHGNLIDAAHCTIRHRGQSLCKRGNKEVEYRGAAAIRLQAVCRQMASKFRRRRACPEWCQHSTTQPCVRHQ